MYNRIDLRVYQLKAIDWVVRKPASGLFIPMGLGKTVVTLSAFLELYQAKKTLPMLVVAPSRVIETVWENQAKEWAHLKHLKFCYITGGAKKRERALYTRADIYLMNVDNMGWLATTLYKMQQVKHKIPFDWLVLDESSLFKDDSTVRFRAARSMLPAFPRKTILTGTPSSQSLLDLWSQVYILDQGNSLGHTKKHYRDRYFELNEHTGKYRPKRAAERHISAAIANLCLRLDKRLLKGLPKIIENEISIVLPPHARCVYNDLERQMFVRLDHIIEQLRNAGREALIEAVNSAVLVGKCHQVANGAVFDSERRKEWHAVHEAKLDTLEEVLSEASGNVMIVYVYRHDKERILARFGNDIPVIGGGNKNTDEIIKGWNAGKYSKILVHPRSASHGLNMQHGGHEIVWYSNQFSAGLYDQLIARLARSGQKNPFVMVHALVAQDTVDNVMRDVVATATRDQNDFLEALLEYQSRRQGRL